MKQIILIIGIAAVLMLAACQVDTSQSPGAGNAPTAAAPSGETPTLKKFDSEDAVIAYIESMQTQSKSVAQNTFRSFGGDMAIAESAMAVDSVAAVADGSDFSGTNVQADGVDEADFVKTDGNYIYVISNGLLQILDAQDPENTAIIATVEIHNNEEYYWGSGSNMFVNDDTLILILNQVSFKPGFNQFDIIPREQYVEETGVYVYDISDRSKPTLEKNYSMSGNYFQARMIGDYVYIVSKDHLNYYGGFIDFPVILEGDRIVSRPEIFYFDNPEDNFVFHTFAALDLDDLELSAESFLMGSGNTFMMSEDNIFIAHRKNQHYWWYRTDNKDRFYEVVVPLLPTNIQSEINQINNNGKSDATQWLAISEIIQNLYNSMDEKEKSALIKEIEDAVEEYDARQAAERRKTVIHKIAVDQEDFDYIGSGEVDGYLLNQFSMDEHDGNVRVATTTNDWFRGERILYNNVFVLDDDMDTIGMLEDIAPDERIFSTRFIGDRLYMVTFQQVDPLFVIDLATPTNPTILGELKIPGFSQYLHPFDDDHIIGIGKETRARGEGFELGGVKVSLFDVSDVTAPKQIDFIEIGQQGSDSEALRDHKAFLFDKEHGNIVLPVREVTGRTKDPRFGYFRNNYWQGAYVLNLNPETGISEVGTITHVDKDADDYYSPYAVRRSLFIDDALFTVSQNAVYVNDRTHVGQITAVDLEAAKIQRRFEPAPTPIAIAETVDI